MADGDTTVRAGESAAFYQIAQLVERFDDEQRGRILRAVALLFGVSLPSQGAPVPRRRLVRPRGHQSVRARALAFVRSHGPVTVPEIAGHIGEVHLATLLSTLSKLTSSGELERVGHGVYQSATVEEQG